MDKASIENIINFTKNSNTEIVEMLKDKNIEVPEWSKLEKAYDASKHDVNDKQKRPDRVRQDKTEPVSRIYLSLQKLLVSRITEFMFAIPVKRTYSNIDNDTRKEISSAMEAVYKHARIDTKNKERSKKFFSSCEICSVWFAAEKKNKLYGFESNYKLNAKTYSPMDGYALYPLLDEYDDMLAMSFEYERKNKKGDTVTFFETYTENRWYLWQKENNEWELTDEKEIKLLKIPAIYAYREAPIWDGLNNIVDEIELTLSRNSDIIAYNAAPILKVVGKMTGSEDKGESRRVWRMEQGGDIGVVAWQQAIEAVKYQVEMLLRLFFMQSQMPDISFENMKGVRAITEPAQRALLTDAHLKVGGEEGVFIEFFEREANVIKAFLKLANTKWANEIDNIGIEHIITPFIQGDEKAEIDKLMKANGGKALLSQEESIEMSGLSANVRETYDKIKAERAEDVRDRSMIDVFNTAE